MAMLAEPRQRRRYNLTPKGKALFEDQTRFGTKMLEKMGWKKGQGLGAKSDGSKDFVRVRYKCNAFGLGFEERDDQWTQHKQNFDGLLKNLNNVEDKGNERTNSFDDDMLPRIGFGFEDANDKNQNSKVENMKEKISGISLEERSRQSKVRVHYKKFTRGKDLAQYSEKDLANIFGEKLIDEHQDATAFYKQLNNEIAININESKAGEMNHTGVSFNDDNLQTKIESCKKIKSDFVIEGRLNTNLTSNEVQSKENDIRKSVKKKEKKNQSQTDIQNKLSAKTFNSNVSINDYFKMKMEAIENIKSGLDSKEEMVNNNEIYEEKSEEFTKKKKKSKKEIKDQEIDRLQKPAENNSKKNKAFQEILFKANKFDNEVIKNVEKTTQCDSKLLNILEERKSEKKKDKSKIKISKSDQISTTMRKFDETHVAMKTADIIEPVLETDFAQVPAKKRKTKNESIETNNNKIIKINDIVEGEIRNIPDHSILGKKNKNKLKSSRPSTTPNTNDNSFGIDNENVAASILTNLGEKKRKSSEIFTESSISGVKLIEIDDNVNDVKSNTANVSKQSNLKGKRTNKKTVKESVNNLPEVEYRDVTHNNSEQTSSEQKEKFKKSIVFTESSTDKDNITEVNDTVKEKTSNASKQKIIKEEKKEGKSKNTTAFKNVNILVQTADSLRNITTNTSNQPILEEKTKKKNEETSVVNGDWSNDIDDNLLLSCLNKQKKFKCSKASDKPSADLDNIAEEDDSVEQTSFEKKNKIKSKHTNLSTEDFTNVDNQKEKDVKTDIKAVNGITELKSNVNCQVLDLDELKKQYKSFNIFQISAFCAEKFRNIQINDFNGSTLSEIEGYGLSPDLQLNVEFKKYDEKRITDLWKGTFNKYVHLDKPKKTYYNYVQEVFKARKTKQKPPKFRVKSWKRGNAFQMV